MSSSQVSPHHTSTCTQKGPRLFAYSASVLSLRICHLRAPALTCRWEETDSLPSWLVASISSQADLILSSRPACEASEQARLPWQCHREPLAPEDTLRKGDVWHDHARLVGRQVEKTCRAITWFWTFLLAFLFLSVKSVLFPFDAEAIHLWPAIPVAVNNWWACFLWRGRRRRGFSCDFDWQIMAFNVFQNDTTGTIFSLTAGEGVLVSSGLS